MTPQAAPQAATPHTWRSTVRAADMLRTCLAGLRHRRARAGLSALGIAIGIAALVAVLGITRSSQSALLAEIDQLGTNLLTVTNGQTLGGQEAELPATATAMIRRVDGVEHAAPTAIVTTARVYRTGKVPVFDTGGLAARAADPSLLAVLGGTVRQGVFLNPATSRYPVTVLGSQAAQTLGIPAADAGGHQYRVLIGGRLFTVAGILNPLPLAPEIDRSALVGFPVAAALLGYDGHPSRIYVRTDVDATAQVAALLGPTADPQVPGRRGGQPAVGRADRAARRGHGVHRAVRGPGRGRAARRRHRDRERHGHRGARTPAGDRPAARARRRQAAHRRAVPHRGHPPRPARRHRGHGVGRRAHRDRGPACGTGRR